MTLHTRLAAFAAVAIITACSTDEYPTGDSDYSYLKAEMAMVTTSEAKILHHALADSGDSLVFTPQMNCSWATTPDSTYRAMVYYSCEDPLPNVRGISAQQVLVLRIPKNKPDSIKTDPLSFESAWIDNRRGFLNLGLYVMTGKNGDADRRQTVGVICDTISGNAGRPHTYNITLLHNQNDVPQNYSARVYVSIPIGGINIGDTIRLSANTYDGAVTRSFVK